MNCSSMRKHVGAYVDGELEPARSIDVEQHVAECSECRQHVALERNIKLQVGAALRSGSAPEELRQRVSMGLDDVSKSSRQGYGSTVFLTAAAAVVLLGVSWTQKSGVREAAVVGGALPLFGDIVQKHANPLPAEIQPDQPEQVVPWFRGKVRFQVHPVAFKESGARFLAARIDHVGNMSAATLYYDINGRRLTAVAFEATPEMYEGAERMKLGGRDAYFSNVRGYPVPVIRHGNVAYAFTGDLDQPNLLRVVAGAQIQ